jgi:hypothetical protein
MSTVSDYAGRTVDVAAYKGWKVGAERQVTQALALAGRGGEVIAGIEKLMQRYTIELFTELATLTYLPSRGSSFMIDARSGYWRTGGDVQESFSRASLTLADNLILEEKSTDPEDERFGSAELQAVSLLGDSVSLRVKITSVAGTSFTVLLPLQVVPY